MFFRLKNLLAAGMATLAVSILLACSSRTPSSDPQKEDNQSIDVTGVRITRVNLELYVGEGFLLGAKVSPADATNPRVRWSTSDASVATVSEDEGQVRAIAAGQAVITATTVDGGFTATCPVKVLSKTDPDPPTPPTPFDPGAPKSHGATPTAGQLAWQRQELLMFYHYGQATFSGYDGENDAGRIGIGSWTEALLLKNYKPTAIDTDQWVKTAADNGFKEIILPFTHP